jgi:hypothetical protein
MKTVTLNVEGISQGQWSTFLLELNLMKGTTVNDYTRSTRQTRKRVQQNKRS